MSGTDPDTVWLDREHELIPPDRRLIFGDLARGQTAGRTRAEEVTSFTSHGTALQFAAVAQQVYQRVREEGLGRPVPLSWFLSDL